MVNSTLGARLFAVGLCVLAAAPGGNGFNQAPALRDPIVERAESAACRRRARCAVAMRPWAAPRPEAPRAGPTRGSSGEPRDKRGGRQQQPASSGSRPRAAGSAAPTPRGIEEGRERTVGTSLRVSVAQELAFEREGHCLLRGLVSGESCVALAAAVQAEYDHRAREAYSAKLKELGVSADATSRGPHGFKEALAKACRDRGLPMPALQVYNLHRANRPASRVVRELATSEDMGRVAADLLGVDSVMLYQTGAFFKFAGDPETAWHRCAQLRSGMKKDKYM